MPKVKRKITTNEAVMGLFVRREELKNKEQSKCEIAAINDKIVVDCSFLVYSTAKSYKRFSNYEDLIQEGFVGLVRAVRKFNYRLFPNFFIYAERWIRHNIKRGASRFDIIYSPDRTRVVYGEKPETVDDFGLVAEQENHFYDKETKSKLQLVLNSLSGREKDIVERIFGLNNHPPQTLREIGPVYNLTHERIRQIKNEAINKLKNCEDLEILY